MKDFEEILLEEQKNPNALILEFVNSSYSEDDIVVFVEGIDDPVFYYDFIRDKFSNRPIRFFACGGKSVLTNVKSYLDSYDLTVKPFKLFYMCDLDFDFVLGKNYDGILQTQFYSIESYFISKNYIDYLINKFVPTVIKGRLRSQILEEVEKQLYGMAEVMLSPMAALCHIRQKDRYANFDKISTNHFFIYNKKTQTIEFQKDRSRKMRDAVQPDIETCDLNKIRSYAKTMLCLDFRFWLRGKLAMQVLRFIIKNIASRLDEKSARALNQISAYISSTALAQSKSFIGQIPELETYLSS